MSDPASSLAEFLDSQYDDVPEDEASGGLHLRDDGHACWALRRLAGTQQRMAAVKQLAQDQRDLIDAWEAQELEALDRTASTFEGALGDYWRRELWPQVDELMAAGKTFDEAWAAIKTKSKKLPAGTISATKGRDSIVVDDPEALLAWAEEHAPELVVTETVKKVPKDGLAQYNRSGVAFVTPAGEKIPAVRVENPGVTWKAKPAPA